MQEVLQELKERVIKNWRSTVLGVASLTVVLLMHYKVLTMTEFLELIGCYHAVRLAFMKETTETKVGEPTDGVENQGL